MKFQFRLATLLRLREAARDERRAQLAQAYRAEQILREEQGRIDRELADLQAQSRAAAGPGQLDVDCLLESRRYALVLQGRRQQVVRQEELVREEIDRRRQALIEANRQVRVLEELRRRQLQRHRDEENRREIKQLDELAARAAGKEVEA